MLSSETENSTNGIVFWEYIVRELHFVFIVGAKERQNGRITTL